MNDEKRTKERELSQQERRKKREEQYTKKQQDIIWRRGEKMYHKLIEDLLSKALRSLPTEGGKKNEEYLQKKRH